MSSARRPTAAQYTILKQVCNLIPSRMVSELAEAHGVEERSRSFTPWSHVVAQVYAHVTHAIGLNDVCDGLQMNEGVLRTIRGATAPSKNGLSHANRERNSEMAEALYWGLMGQLMKQSPGFGKGRVRRGFLRRFRKAIHAIDATTIQLVANHLNWAKHRRRKAAAKCHLRLDLQSFLPVCAVVEEARHHDNVRARELCAGLKDGEIVLFDKAYVDFEHLHDLTGRRVWWVTRAKDNLQYRVVRRLATTGDERVLSDEEIELTVPQTRGQYPGRLRRVVARVEVDGREMELEFLTNHLEWSAWTVAELYRGRWEIEVFFKEIKQTLQLADFLGHNANAVRWQVWMGLVVHLLLRYLAYLSEWRHGFTRLFTVIRAVLWRRWALTPLLESYGTAGGRRRICGSPEQAYLPGFR